MLNEITFFFKFKIKELLTKQRRMGLFFYNKRFQKIFDLSITDYISYYNRVIIELTPLTELKEGENIFINYKEENKNYYHIYFNDSYIEVNKRTIKNDENVKKIKVVIDHNINNFSGLFSYCDCLKGIKVIKCEGTHIVNLNSMFKGCKSLIDLDVIKLKTDNVKTMKDMFFNCSSLKKLDLSNFITKNVCSMFYMFCGCSSLIYLNIDNFNTSNVKNMASMFAGCSSLTDINVSNFNTSNVINMNFMFEDCTKLINLNISNFNFTNATKFHIFYNCSNSLQKLVKTQNNMVEDFFFK